MLEIQEPMCPRCRTAGFIQILDWRRSAGWAQALYVCHGCDRTYSHPVPVEWQCPGGWLPTYV